MPTTRITVVILELILALQTSSEVALIRFPTNALWASVNHSNLADRYGFGRDASFKFLPYQLSMVVYWTTMALTGNGELGFDSGEGA